MSDIFQLLRSQGLYLCKVSRARADIRSASRFFVTSASPGSHDERLNRSGEKLRRLTFCRRPAPFCAKYYPFRNRSETSKHVRYHNCCFLSGKQRAKSSDPKGVTRNAPRRDRVPNRELAAPHGRSAEAVERHLIQPAAYR